MKQIDRILEARDGFRETHPFYFETLSLLTLDQDNRGTETIALDGDRLIYNTGYISHLDDAELRFVLAFAAFGFAFNWKGRRQGRDPARWNVAFNYAAVSALAEVVDFRVPPNTPHEPQFDGLSAEEVYVRLAA
jgi:hypothetical protein